MKVSSEPMHFERDVMFTRSSLCKVFEITDARQSGEIPHSHDYTQIWYVSKGCCDHWVEDAHYPMTRGDVFILPPRMTHTTILRPDSSIICCEMSLDRILPDTNGSAFRQVKETALNLSFVLLFMQEAKDVRACFRLSPETDERVEKLMRRMLWEYESALPYYEDCVTLLIQELFILIVRQYAQSPAHDASNAMYAKYRSLVAAGVEYVDAHFMEQITLEDVCRVAMVSKTYFCYLFKLLTKMTFKEYLVDLRIKNAIRLLEDPRNSIAYISQSVGFADSTHFSRTFKKLVGISPRSYRTLHFQSI